nr:hypothetical protein RKHAN_02333 [Rhizobium sp. Khangiran2]
MSALAACEYSHCCLSTCQSDGMLVQFSVAWFAGAVHIKKITNVNPNETAAPSAVHVGHLSCRWNDREGRH